MRDNKTSQAAVDYDSNVTKTIPYYELMHNEIIDLVGTRVVKPGFQLDAGCGTGTFLRKAAQQFGDMKFVAADSSENMLDLAKEKLTGLDVEYILSDSENLEYATGSLDVITSILAHHYLDAEARKRATLNCFKALKVGGVYVTVETIKPLTEKGLDIGLQRWRASQLRSGKKPADAEKHLSRYGVELFPITVDAHLTLLKEIGFSVAEVFWVSGLQAGVYGIK